MPYLSSKTIQLTLMLLLCVPLVGCVTQDQADVKMAKGCAGVINHLMMGKDKELGEIESQTFAMSNTEGGLHRLVTIKAKETDGWMENDKEYNCLFAQQWGLFKSKHKAILVQFETDNEFYGKKQGVIEGGLDVYLKMTEAADKAMAGF